MEMDILNKFERLCRMIWHFTEKLALLRPPNWLHSTWSISMIKCTTISVARFHPYLFLNFFKYIEEQCTHFTNVTGVCLVPWTPVIQNSKKGTDFQVHTLKPPEPDWLTVNKWIICDILQIVSVKLHFKIKFPILSVTSVLTHQHK